MPVENANRFISMNQAGVVVRDLDKAIDGMRKLFGAEPDTVAETRKTHRLYRGESGDFAARIALYNFANIQFEFVQPLEGPSIWQDHLDAHGEGLQHVCFKVDDYAAAESQMAKAGAAPYQQGLAVNRPLRWDYFETEPLIGFTVETCSPIDCEPDQFKR